MTKEQFKHAASILSRIDTHNIAISELENVQESASAKHHEFGIIDLYTNKKARLSKQTGNTAIELEIKVIKSNIDNLEAEFAAIGNESASGSLAPNAW